MERAPVRAPLIKNLELKVGILLVLTIVLAVAFVVYAFYARGAFERTQRLTLVADNAEGVSVGMPMTFSGFPIGQVKRMTLAADGRVRLEMAIPVRDAKWLRASSAFSLEKALVGGAKIRAFSANLADPPLGDGAERPLLTGDAAQEIPIILARVKAILDNVDLMTRADSNINQSLGHVREVTQRMTGEYGVMEGVLGTPEHARKVVQALDHTNTLLKSLNGVSLKVDSVLTRTDQRVNGPGGVMDEVKKATTQVNTILGDTRDSLKKVDAILANVQTVSGDVKDATADLGALRGEVDDSLAKVNHLINEINRKWPFKRDVELKLP